MKQLGLQGIPQFANGPTDASYAQVVACRSEAEAVRWSIEFAREVLGANQLTIAKLCGWRSSSFLSEIAKEANEKRFPPERIGKFVLATGTRLLEQWIERRDAERQAAGKTTEADRSKAAVAAMVNDLRRAAA
jgi:hypothetical protein